MALIRIRVLNKKISIVQPYLFLDIPCLRNKRPKNMPKINVNPTAENPNTIKYRRAGDVAT